VFRIFLAAPEGPVPVVLMENMTDLSSLGEEFNFTSLLSHATDFISAHSVLDSEGPKGTTDITEENLHF
jgi:hypothetical protein